MIQTGHELSVRDNQKIILCKAVVFYKLNGVRQPSQQQTIPISRKANDCKCEATIFSWEIEFVNFSSQHFTPLIISPQQNNKNYEFRSSKIVGRAEYNINCIVLQYFKRFIQNLQRLKSAKNLFKVVTRAQGIKFHFVEIIQV